MVNKKAHEIFYLHFFILYIVLNTEVNACEACNNKPPDIEHTTIVASVSTWAAFTTLYGLGQTIPILIWILEVFLLTTYKYFMPNLKPPKLAITGSAGVSFNLMPFLSNWASVPAIFCTFPCGA